MEGYMLAFTSFLLVCSLAFTLQVLFFPSISPDPLEFPKTSVIPENKLLQEATKLGEGILDGPEDVWIDRDGTLYTATRDGWIKRMHRNGSWEDWKKIESNGLLGITTSRDGSLIVCDAEQGVLKVSEDHITVLASQVNGSKLSNTNEVIEASDGTLYFSVFSNKYEMEDWYMELFEAKPHGQLLKYDPTLKETSVVLDGLWAANGVALSREEDFLVVCETLKFRCLRYWLKDKPKGKTEIFVDQLPGAPDNIHLAPDGSFWIALPKLVPDGLEFVHSSKFMKRLIASSPRLIKLINGFEKKATVVNVAADGGKIIRRLDDPDGKVVPFVTSAFQFEDHLYLGSYTSKFIGKMHLKAS